MMGAAGLSVAYHAKPKVRAAAMVAIDDGGLDRLLEVLRPAEHDDAVGVGPEPIAGADPDALHLHCDVALALLALLGGDRHERERADADLRRRELGDVAHRAVDDTPVQPFFAAAAATLPPTRARRSDAPPSTTRTRPWPGSSSAALTSELSSKHLTVATVPANAWTPP